MVKKKVHSFLANQESQSYEQIAMKEPSSLKWKLGSVENLWPFERWLQCQQLKIGTRYDCIGISDVSFCFDIFYARSVGSVHKATRHMKLSGPAYPHFSFTVTSSWGSAFSSFGCNYHLTEECTLRKQPFLGRASVMSFCLYSLHFTQMKRLCTAFFLFFFSYPSQLISNTKEDRFNSSLITVDGMQGTNCYEAM